MQIGNAVIHDKTDGLGMYQYFGSHALVAQRTVRQIEKHCDTYPEVMTKKCNAALDEVDLNLANLDIYNIYAPICHDSNLTAKPKKVTVSSSTPQRLYSEYIKAMFGSQKMQRKGKKIQ